MPATPARSPRRRESCCRRTAGETARLSVLACAEGPSLASAAPAAAAVEPSAPSCAAPAPDPAPAPAALAPVFASSRSRSTSSSSSATSRRRRRRRSRGVSSPAVGDDGVWATYSRAEGRTRRAGRRAAASSVWAREGRQESAGAGRRESRGKGSEARTALLLAVEPRPRGVAEAAAGLCRVEAVCVDVFGRCVGLLVARRGAAVGGGRVGAREEEVVVRVRVALRAGEGQLWDGGDSERRGRTERECSWGTSGVSKTSAPEVSCGEERRGRGERQRAR